MSLYQQMLQVCRKLIGATPRTFSFWNRHTYLHTPRPKWLKSDSATRVVFDDRPNLLAHGEVVWGHIVQANEQIFDEGNSDVPALVLLCPNPEIAVDLDELGIVSRFLFTLKNTVPKEENLKDIAAALTNEYSTPRALSVPRSVSRRLPLVMTTIFFARKHLPGRRLCTPYLPILINAHKPGFATPLPEKYWPADLKANWMSGQPSASRPHRGDGVITNRLGSFIRMFLPLAWAGKGWLVPTIAIVSLILAQLITWGLTGSQEYWDEYRWPGGAALFTAGAICAHYARLLDPNEIGTLLAHIESQKLRTFYLVRLTPSDAQDSHSFFWVPLKYWSVLLSLVAAYLFAVDLGWVPDD